MSILTNKEALAARRDASRAKFAARHRTKTLVNVSCGTCGIASGAERVLAVMQEAVRAKDLPNVEFIRSGCMTYCYAEPTVTITRPGEEPETFGYVDDVRARALVNDYIAQGRPVEGKIAVAYLRVEL